MRYKAILPFGLVQQIDTLRPITHAIIGQRDEKAERPATFRHSKVTLDNGEKRDLTPEEEEANIKHRARVNTGYYNFSALDWFESEDAAIESLSRWAQLINVRIVPVTPAAYAR